MGTVVVDHQVMVDRLPERDAKCEILTDRYQIGGPVPTALTLLRRWGIGTSFLGAWFGDREGELIEADLISSGVQVDSRSHLREGRSGFAHVWVEKGTGRRSIAAFRGSREVSIDDIAPERLGSFDVLHLDGWSTEAALVAAKAMNSTGGIVFIDLGSPKKRLSELLNEVSYLNCPLGLVHRLCGCHDPVEGARALLGERTRFVTVTDGEKGAWLVPAEGEALFCPGLKVRAIDTNGAGDTFSGALIYAVKQQWNELGVLRFASAAAGLKCRALGNREALPTLDEVLSAAKELGG